MGGLDGGTASGTNIAVGAGSAVRSSNRYTPTYGIAIGNDALVLDGDIEGATGSIAIGHSANSSGSGSVVIGDSARNLGSAAVAVGSGAYTQRGVAVGAGAAGNANRSTALGNSATSTATNSVALGNDSLADRANSVSVGSSTLNRQITNVAAGTQATDAVDVAQLTPVVTALGGGATINATTGAVTGPTYNLTNGGRQTTVGGALTALDNALTTSNRFVKVNGTTDATANGAGSIAIGSGATTTPLIGGSSTGQTAIGNGATANGLSSTALGSSAEANGTGALAAGRLSNATGNSSTALGNQASAQAGGATALGNLASVAAGATNSVAIGNNASVAENVTNAMALGTNAIANRNDTISVGSATQQRQITNLAAGTQDTDAVNLAQLNAAIANVGSDSPYFQANGAGDGSDAASAVGAGSVAVGSNASTVADGGIAIGNNAKSEMQNGVAIGNAAVASEDGVAIGRDAHAQSANSLAFGAQSSAAANGTSLGFNAKAADNAMALGANTVAAGSNSVALGNGSVASVANTVSVGSAGNERKIVNVADGDLSATSTDAVNGSQLFATNTRVGSLEDSLKGGGVIDPTTGESLAVVYDGTAKDTVTLAGANGTTLTNVKAGVADMDAVNVSQLKDSGLIGNDGKAIAAVTYDRNADGTPNYGSVTLGDGNGPVKVTNVADATGDSDALNLGQLKQAGLVGEDGQGNLTSLAVAYDDASKGTVTLGGGAAGTTITNVKAGDLSATSTDAVNGSQLFATNQSVGDLRDSLQNGGVIDPVTGQSLAVTYDDATKAGVTLGNAGTPVAIHNVAAGDLSATSTDAVNGSQLFATNTRVGSLEDSLQNGGVIDPVTGQSLAVVYDDATKAGVTLGNAGTPVAIHNVAAGDLSATSTDAVNGSQLFATNQSVGDLRDSLQNGGVIDPTTGESLAVVYDSAAKNRVTLGGAGASGPVTLSNVAAGVAATDAVNVQQMQQAVATGNPYIGGRGTGVAAQATGINAVALGLGSLANEINTISVGNSTTGLQRRITNVQNGEADSDAATVGQVNELMGVASTSTQAALDNIDTKTTSAIQDVNSRLDAINTVAGTDPYVQVDGAGDGSDNASVRPGTYGVAIGAEANATGNTAIAIGAQSVSSGNSSVALGAGASATATGAVAFGSGRATGTSALALGNGTNASGNNAVAAGFNAGASGLNALAFGNTARANATDSMAFGTTAQVDPLATNGIAIGRAANVTSAAQNSVALGSNSVADRLNSISVGSTSQQRQIIYVSKGTADTDAVNVSQLKDAVSAFGGNASVGADGSIVNPTYTFDGATYHNVGDALNALAQRGGGSDPLAVTYAKNPDGSANFDLVSLAGVDGTTLTNLKAGALSATSTDAVNGSQLFATNERVGSLEDSLQNGGVIDPTTGESLAVVYDGTAKDKVTLAGGATGTTISNVKAGVADMDAVNVSQLKDSGLIGNDGKAIAAVTYDRNPDGTPNYGSVTLGDGNGPVKVTNVADATGDSDALNLGQLKQAGLVGEDGQGNLTSLAVAYDDASKGTVTLGGGAAGTTITNVKAGELSATSTDAVNGSQLFATNQDIGDLRDSLQSGGVIDPTTGESLAVVYDGTAKDKVTLAGGATGTTISNVKAGVADMDAVNVSQLKDSGLIGNDGKAIAAVTYDRNPDGTANYGSVTLGNGNGPVKVSNVADATGDRDALNLGQLKQAGLVGEDGQGNLTSLAVAYDDASKGTVTLGGGAAGTTITNVKAGELSATSTDAVNGSQLFATNQDIGDLRDSLQSGGVIDPTTGESLAVVYDGTAKDKVTLAGGATGTTISNVKAGVADMDAVNVSQLKDSGLIGNDGKAIAAVTYDRNTDGTPNYGSVTLGNGNGPVKVSNVAAATADTDAVNYGQMKDYVDGSIGVPGNPLAVAYDDTSKGSITLGGANGTTITNVAAGEVSATSTDAINGSQLHGVSQSVADSLGGGSTVGADGTVTNPTYSLADPADASQKHDYHNVGDALANLDGRVVDNTTNITVIKNQLSDSGLVDPVTGQSIAAVTYDRNADGTPNYNSVTLRGTDGTTLANVKAGVADLDAVNVSQLKGSGLIDPVTGQSIAAVTYDRNPDGTANYGSVTLGNGNGPVKVTNVADATGDSDALNLGQLKQAGLVGEDGQGNLTSLAVAYDDASKGTVTLGGGAAGTTITNVKAGELSATSTDAVNGSQLFATNQDIGDLRDSLKGGGVIDPVTGESLAVVYDSAAKNQVTLGGANATTPVQLKNVAAGTDGTDAVNVAQLKEAGLVAPVDPTNPGAGLTSLAVTYGDASKSTVALGGANGTTLSNVAAGAVSATSTDAINGSQLHGVSQSVADSLGGGSTVGADGTVTNPTYSLADPADASQKHDYHNVGDALANLDGRVVDNTTNITVIKNQLADSGLVDPVTGQSIAAVTYDRNTDGTPNYGSVTLGNGNDPVKVSNVADGVDRHDAVNLGQLQDAGLVAPVDPTNPGTMTSLAVTYGKNTDGTANFDQVVLAGKGGTTISNVKAGAVTATSTDAINGAQLHGVSQSVADSLGGGSTVDADGKVTSPTYVVNNQTFNNVGDAITNISNSLVDGSIGLVQQDATTRDITVAKDTDGTVVDFTGTAGDRVLTGVAAGAVNATSNDAINGSQLHGTAQSVADVIGGGTTVDADGKLADTAIDVNGQKYSTVAEAVQAAAAYGATDSLAVRYDLNGDGTPNFGSVTLGGSGAAPVQLKNVADGVNKYDAVNFGQLSELNDKIDDMDGRVGALEQNPGNGGGTGDSPYFSGTDVTPGSSTAANAGTGTGNTAAGSGASVGGGANNATVIGSNASATKDNGAAIGSGAKSTGEGATAIGSNASASGSQSVAIGSGSVANEANTVSFGNGTDDGNRRIVNIADGINANDAASKGQLDRAVGGLQGQINDVSKNAYSGIAAATALTMIPGVDPGKTLSFGVGGATYKGYQAVAFGGEARITQNLKMKAGVGLSSGGNTVGVGASYQW
nr:YadA-like family protein [Burkholderia sp. GbtcB21]